MPIANERNADSVRGTLHLVGPEPSSWLAMTTATDQQVVLLGERDVLEQFEGSDIVVFGTMLRGLGHISGARTAMSVARIIVRTMNDGPAYDGIFRRGASGNVLEMCGGKRVKLGPLYFKDPDDGERIVINSLEFPNTMKQLKSGTP